jgi:hypothetical protein
MLQCMKCTSKALGGLAQQRVPPLLLCMVMQQFTRSPQKSTKHCVRGTGIDRSSVQRILKRSKWKIYIPRLLHAMTEGTRGCGVNGRKKLFGLVRQQTLKTLREDIEKSCAAVRVDTLATVARAPVRRPHKGLQACGGHFGHSACEN